MYDPEENASKLKPSPKFSNNKKDSPKLNMLRSFRRSVSKRSLLSAGRRSPCPSVTGSRHALNKTGPLKLYVNIQLRII